MTIIGPTRYETPEQFENILLKVNLNGSQVLLKDVARVELGAQQYSPYAKYNNQPVAAIALKLAAGANQLTTESAVRNGTRRAQAVLPARHADRLPARYRAVHHPVHHRSGQDPAGGDRYSSSR